MREPRISAFPNEIFSTDRCPILWADFLVQGTSKKFGFLVKGKVVHVEGNVLAAHTITEIALEVEITISNIVDAKYNINCAGTPPTIGVVVAAANYTKRRGTFF